MTDRFLFEMITRAESKNYICRIWRERTEFFSTLQERAEILLLKLEWDSNPKLGMEGVIQELCSFEGVNSVEIIERESGCGLCLHKNWP